MVSVECVIVACVYKPLPKYFQMKAREMKGKNGHLQDVLGG